MDPHLLTYVARHAGKGVITLSSCPRRFLNSTRNELKKNILEAMWNPTARQQRIVQEKLNELPGQIRARLGELDQLERKLDGKFRQARAELDRARGEPLRQLQKERQAIWKQVAANQLELIGFEQGLVQARHADQQARQQAEYNLALEQLLRELSTESLDVVAEKLQDEQPVVRWLAALVTHRRRLPLERELLDRLTDAYPQVREAARQGLVKLSRGNDFGPAPNATAAQATQAQRSWRQWLSMQDLPGRALVAPGSPATDNAPPKP
jgi:hypothetical protein